MGNKLKLDQKLREFLKTKASIMRSIANNSVNFFKVTNFDKQGFVNVGVSRWAERKVKESRKILVKTGAGRQSIHIAEFSENQVLIKAEAEYMNYHNTGTVNIPQRKFMGNSVTLDKQNKAIIDKALKKIM